jgi:hypothetical protein
MTNNWTGWGEFFIFSQILFYVPSFYVITWWAPDNVIHGIFSQWHALPAMWFGLFLVSCILMLIDFGILQTIGIIRNKTK